MRLIAALLLAAAVTGPHTALAQPTCTDGIADKLSLTPKREHLRFKGSFTPPTVLDPLSSGLSIAIAYEPVTGPGDVFFSATIPSGAFTPTTHFVRYRDHTASINGLKLVVFGSRSGVAKVKVNRRGPALGNTNRSGLVSVTLTSGGACVRSCITCTSGSRFKCQANGDPGACG